MTTLYALKFRGQSDTGGAAICIGNGQILGVDGSNIRYHGIYEENDSKLCGTITLIPKYTVNLVTGDVLYPDTEITANFTWPADFDGGQELPINIGGKKVYVKLDRIGEIKS